MLLRDLTVSPFRISCKVHITDMCHVSLVKATESNTLLFAQRINSLCCRENIQGTGIIDYHQNYFDHYQPEHSLVMSRPAKELIFFSFMEDTYKGLISYILCLSIKIDLLLKSSQYVLLV